MDAVLASTIDLLEDVVKLPDLQSELAFTEHRHTEPLTGLPPIDGSWRSKERVKTVSVALVLCLNVGVDPPDVVKIEPCAHLECWVDPLSEEPQKAIEYISLQLEKQYEQWHSRARYKKCLDPTVDEVKKLCNTLRRYSKQERVLFHYNGHGVPKPTQNGEIWVFNDKYTQYIPLNVYELQQWMSTPSIYVFDCSCAGSIVNSFLEFAKQHKSDYELELAHYAAYQKTLQQRRATNSNQNGEANNQIEMNQNNLHDINGTTAPTLDDTDVKGSFQQEDNNQDSSNNPTQDASVNVRGPPIKRPDYETCLHLAACEAHQILPMQPDLPADLFTSCLTTPIKMALRWFIQKNDSRFMPKISQSLVDRIPGSLGDRSTMLGELNWIFTSITDTIAWDVLPRDLFQRLYRQDLLVASLFRNFLLADRIMRTYDCTPVSHPKLPKTYHHPMWRAWDMVVDLFLSQLVDVLEERAKFKSSSFFAEQLTAFEVWLDLDHSSNKNPDHHLLPIILQVLLSQVHRLRALDLLSRFLNLGPGAVNSALNVGIFPYVLKLLQSKGREVRPFLLSIWAKILAFDRRCQVDLIRDHNHRYFLAILSDTSYDAHYRTMAAFVMSCVVRDFRFGQELAYQASLIAYCLEQLDDPDPMLRKWLAICLGLSWDNFEDARWCGVRSCAHEKLYSLLDDSDPEVRAASVFALGTFINSSSERTDHANTIDHSIGMKLVSTSLYDSSILVRRELVVALQYLVLAFESQFLKLEQIAKEEERKLMDVVDSSTLVCGTPPSMSSARAHASGFLSPTMQINRSASKNFVRHPEAAHGHHHPAYYHQGINLFPMTNFIPRVNSLNAIPVNYGPTSKIVGNVYHIIWKAMYTLAADPHPNVASIAQIIIDEIRSCSLTSMSTESLRESKSNSSISESSSPNTGGATFSISESPPTSATATTSNVNSTGRRNHQSGRAAPHHNHHAHQADTNGPGAGNVNVKLSESSSANHNNGGFYGNNRDITSQATLVAPPPPSPPSSDIGQHQTSNNNHHHQNQSNNNNNNNIERITKSANVTISNNHKSRRYASSRDNNVSEEDSRSNISSHKPLITTEFVDWSTKYFIDPENNFTSCYQSHSSSSSSSSIINNNARQSGNKQDRQREWRMLKTLSYKNVCLKELMIVDPARFNESSSNLTYQQVPNLIAVHPYDPIMIVSGRDEFSVMHLDGPHVNSHHYSDPFVSGPSGFLSSSSSATLIGGAHHISSIHNQNNNHSHHNLCDQQHANHHNHNSHHHHNDLIGTQTNSQANPSHITSLQLINPQYNTLVCTGSNDGSVRIWRAYDSNDFTFSPQLVTAFHLMPELLSSTNRASLFYQGPNVVNGSGGVGTGVFGGASNHQTSVAAGLAQLSLSTGTTTNGPSSGLSGLNQSSISSSTNNGLSSGTLINSSNNINGHNLGMVLLWDQDQSNFYVTSDQNDARIIRVWDANSESKVQDIPTCAEFGVSCLSSDGEHSIAAGFLDGSIRIYDTRLKKTDCRTFTFRKHSEKILGLHMFKPGEKHINLVSGDSGGEVRFWDKRAPTSVKRVDVGHKMNVMTVHPNSDIFACGLRSGHGIKIYNLDGTSRPGCVIKTQDNTFFTSRHNPSVNCLAFHPLRTSLVCGYSDSVISIYSSRTMA